MKAFVSQKTWVRLWRSHYQKHADTIGELCLNGYLTKPEAKRALARLKKFVEDKGVKVEDHQ